MNLVRRRLKTKNPNSKFYRHTRKSERGALHVKVDDDVDRERGPDGGGNVTVVRPGTRILVQLLVDSGLEVKRKKYVQPKVRKKQ